MTVKEKMKCRTADKDFVKVYRKQFPQIAELAMARPKAFTILCLLMQQMDGTNSICANMQLIGDCVGLTRQSVSKHLKYLENNGWIQRKRLGHNTVYVINDMVAWTSYATQRASCSFSNYLSFEKAYCGSPTWVNPRNIEKSFVKTLKSKNV